MCARQQMSSAVSDGSNTPSGGYASVGGSKMDAVGYQIERGVDLLRINDAALQRRLRCRFNIRAQHGRRLSLDGCDGSGIPL